MDEEEMIYQTQLKELEEFESEITNELTNILSELADITETFCRICAYPRGAYNVENNAHFGSNDVCYNMFFDDFDFYALTKSTKTLRAILFINQEHNYNFNEDTFILIRSIFENYLFSRYYDNQEDSKQLFKDFLSNPLELMIGNLYILNKSIVKRQDNKQVGKIITGPKDFLLGLDSTYYSMFYSFLCSFSHCNFSNISSYIHEYIFTLNKNIYRIESLLFTLFTFTKLLEEIITVDGESFIDDSNEKHFYDLVYDSLQIQHKIFSYLITKYSYPQTEEPIIYLYLKANNSDPSNYNSRHKQFKKMLIKMKNSLKDNIGDLDKSKFDETTNTYIRSYPVNDN
ncbi:MAG: hypothetical protein E7231_03260 [Cellulosilyticum sp.]|nr:hypothetical protein [Cellulosilyticum sp.]